MPEESPGGSNHPDHVAEAEQPARDQSGDRARVADGDHGGPDHAKERE